MVLLRMGLYDTPLPPRPPPRDDRNENKPDDSDEDDDDDEDGSRSTVRLFQFNKQGKEVNDLLPSLGRRLDTGIDCYFEPRDRKVRNLVDKTMCHVEDACWALEACKGDVTEAWTRISTARRLSLNVRRVDDEEFVDPDSWDVEMEELFDYRKQQRLADEKRNAQTTRWTPPDDPNQQWTPGKANPTPVDDEPWFTG